MAAALRRSEPEIYKVDTIPPPAGEDAYSAPTKVGPMARAAVGTMFPEMCQEERACSESAPPRSGVRSLLPPANVPVVYDEADDSQLDPTGLLLSLPSYVPPPIITVAPLPSTPSVASRPPIQETVTLARTEETSNRLLIALAAGGMVISLASVVLSIAVLYFFR